MGTRNTIKGPALAALLLLMAAVGVLPAAGAVAGGALCPPGKKQFWDAPQERCRECSVCREPRRFVLRACHLLADTKCGFARELAMGRARPRPPATAPASTPRGRRKGAGAEGGGGSAERAGHWPAALVRRMHKHTDRNNGSSSAGRSHDLKKYRDYLFHHHHHHQKARPPESAAQLLGAGAAGTSEAMGAPLSAAEALPWDWQAAVLVAAVAACALFFGAAALHGLRQLRQDARRSADADNLSATLSLMVPELINDIPYSCSVDGHNANQCLYIEQLLVRKNEESKGGQGNVYIDRGKGKMHE